MGVLFCCRGAVGQAGCVGGDMNFQEKQIILEYTGCVFFHNSLQPLAYIAVTDLQSSQRNASVQSLLLAGNFLYNQ